ncbi:MAG TPA: alpha/beta hydrolase [Candidatus Nanoarchaeia archaeon]|nr:alpha/beta hydrolase [Candidatus Nanoarchaeia archaeon]
MKLVFIHGSAGSKKNFKYLVQELEKFNCLAFDLIGFGSERKPKVKYDLDLFMNDINGKINSTGKVILIGHSVGAILAKEYALRNSSVQKVFLINYPMKKEIIRKHWFHKMFIDQNILAKLLCHTKSIWKYLFYPYFIIFKFRYFDSFLDYFKHSFHSENSTLHEVLLKDDPSPLKDLEDRIIFISGGLDPFVDKPTTRKYKHYVIRNMKHSFFNHETEIARIIKVNIS